MAEITIRISDRTLKVVGILLGIALLTVGFAHFWSTGLLRPKYQLHIYVPEAPGVSVGAAVRLAGMPVGTINKVELTPNSTDANRRIEIGLRIQKRFQEMIREDSSATLITEGLLGSRYVSIEPGFSGPPISSGGEIRTIPTKEFNTFDFKKALRKMANCEDEETENKAPIPPKKSLSVR